MGQATVDLPDPLNTPAPTTSAGTDDLLSQLAGEEIDRLLADADSGPVSSSPIADSGPPSDSTHPPQMSVNNDTAPHPSAAAASPPQAQKESDPELAAALENLLDGLDEKLAASPAPQLASAAEPSAINPAAQVQISAPSADELGTTSSEREALNPQVVETQGEVISQDEIHSNEDDSLPIFLKPLEWLNAPLANASESVRDVIGKLAILTLVNAFAILIYVFLFRRH